MFLGRVKTSTVNTKDRKKADRGFAREAKRKSPSVSRASESDPDTFDAPTEATTRDTADKKAQRKPKKSRTAEAPASHSAPKYRETKAVTQSTTNLQCTYNGNLLFTVEEESNSKESRPKPADIPNPTPQTSSPGEEVAVESLTVLSTQAEDKQPVHEEDASPSHKEDVPNKSSTVVSAAVEQQDEDDNNKSSPIEQPMHESFEALSKGAEKPASVEEDVYCPSHREGVPDEPSTVLPTEEEKKQAEDEDAVPSPSEDCHAESSTVLPTDVELQQPVHCEDVCPSPKEEDFDAESSTSKPTDAEQQQPLPDNDQSSFLVEELSRKLSISDSLPTEKSMQHRPLHQASLCVRYVHLHEYERACPILTDDLLHGSPDDAPEEAGCVTPEPTRRHSGLLRDSAPGSPDDAPHEAECVTPEPTRRHSGLLRDSEPGSPDEALDDAECVTPEPTRRHSGLLRDTEPRSPDDAPEDAGCVTPKPTRRHSGLLRDTEPESPDDALDDAECVTPEPTKRHSSLLRDPALGSPDEALDDAECVTPEPTRRHSGLLRDTEPGSPDEALDDAECVTPEPTRRHSGLLRDSEPGSPDEALDDAECVTPEPTRRHSGLLRDTEPESPDDALDDAECVTPEPTKRHSSLLRDPALGSPDEALDDAECVTPEPTRRHSGLLRDTEPGSPDEALDDAECVTPEPTRRHSGLLRDSEPGSPDEALDDAECVTPEPTRRHSGLLRDPALESPDEAPHEAECVTPEPTIGFSRRYHDDALAPESSEAVPAEIDCVTRLRQLYQLSPVENPAHVSPEAAPDKAECLTPEPTRRYPTLHRDPVPAVPESSEAIPTELECVTPVHRSPSNPVDDPVTEPSEAMPAEAECQTPVHEEIHQSPIDGSAHVSSACEQASTVKEEAAMTYEDYLNMLGKRPVHESANDLPLDADRRSPAHGGFSASHGCVLAHESSNALPVEAAQRSPARGHNHPNLRTTFVPESSSSSRPSGRSAPTDPMAPSGSGETPEIEIIEPLPSYWTGHPSSGVGNDDDLMCNLVAFSMFQEDGQADPDDFIRQQSLLLDAYRNARDVKDQQPVDNPAQVTQPSIPQQPPDGAWTGKIFFRECEITGATAECPISLPPQLTIEARVPMTYVFRLAENPAIKKIEHHFFQITPTVPNRLFHKLLRHLKGRKAAGVVHLQGFNITLYLVPALESSCMELGVVEDPMNKLVCFLIAT